MIADYNEPALEHHIAEQFGIKLDVARVIVWEVPVSRTATATVFLTAKKQLYCFIDAKSKQTLGDVKKVLSRMGLRPELFIPPRGEPHYFDDIAQANYVKIFPGKRNPSDQDLAYYRTLAPYNPALIQIAEIPTSEIKQFDTDAATDWRVAVRFAYRRIKTS